MCLAQKILLITSNFPPVRGGSASVYLNLVKKADGKIMVLSSSFDYTTNLPLQGWRESDMKSGIDIRRIELVRAPILLDPTIVSRIKGRLIQAKIMIQVSYEITKVVVNKKVRVICIGELLSCAWILHLCKLLPRVHSIAYVHGEELTTQNIGRPLISKLRSALKAADRVIVVSRFTKSVADQILVNQTEKTVLISNGVDTKKFTPGRKNSHLVKKYQIESSFVFVSVCRLVEKKGLDKAIEAFAYARTELAETKLLIVGDGPFRERLSSLISSYNLQEQVLLLGAVSEADLVDYYRLGDAFIMPNRSLPNGDTEGFGLVFLEANSCGLPVISGRDGGSVEAVQNEVNGLVVDGSSASEIASAMIRLRSDEGLRARLIQAGLRIAKEADWEHRTNIFMRTATELGV